MKKLALAVTFAAAAALVPGSASAQLSASLRLGYAVGNNEYSKDVKMRQTLKAQIPIQLDLGTRVLPKLTLGLYGAYGVLKPGAVCPPTSDCSGNVIDFGLQAIYRFTTRPVSPWASVGVGWEKSTLEIENVKAKAEGVEFLRLGAGWEFPMSDGFGIGPFVQYQLGQYSSFDVPGATGQPDRGLHSWFTVGVRGTLDDMTDWDAKAKAAADKLAAEKAAAEKAAADKLAAERAAAEKAAAEAKAAADAAAAKAAAEAAAAEAAAKPDRDGDGIPDAVDACPDQKGEANADAKKNGCKALIVVTEKGIDLREKIQFQTGKAVIKPESEPVLKSVAEILAAHPEIKKLSIEGHTDNVGSEAGNVALSKKRAAAVVTWLVTKGGIAADRFVSDGFGPTRPIADNATEEGRAANRRVELLIVK